MFRNMRYLVEMTSQSLFTRYTELIRQAEERIITLMFFAGTAAESVPEQPSNQFPACPKTPATLKRQQASRKQHS